MIKIAISGKAKSGKNTFSTILKNLFIKDLKIKSSAIQTEAFADPVKQMASILFPGKENAKNFWGPSEAREFIIPNTSISYRKPLLDIGSIGRSYDKDIWAKLLISKLKASKKSIFIVSDLRFPNEYSLLKENDFFFIRIKRNNYAKINDVSETDQDLIPDTDFDSIIENNSTKKNFKIQAENILPIIKAKYKAY